MSRSNRYVRNSAYATVVRRRPSLDFSITGLVFSSLMMFMCLAAINSQANLLFGVFGVMIGILQVSLIVSRWVLRRLTLTRGMPDSAIVGVPTFITYELRNEQRYWASLSVTVADLDGVEAFTTQPQAYMLHAAPRMTAIVPAQVTPKRRGLHQLNRYQLSTSFPFGFIKRASERRQPESILIYPAIAQLDPKLLLQMRSAESSGATMRPRRGGYDEFFGLKDFRSGENPRYIYWRRSARTGTLVAKEMTHVSPPRMIVLVDTFLAADQRASERLGEVERAIAMAASLVSHSLESGLSVGLVVWSDRWVAIAPNRGKRHRRDLLTILAQLPPNSEHDSRGLSAAATELQESSTTLVMFSSGTSPLSRSQRDGATLVIPANSEQGRRWFRFAPTIDFMHTMPPNQEPEANEL